MAVVIADGSTYSVVEFTVPGSTQGITPGDINDNGEIVGYDSTAPRTASAFVSQFGYDDAGNPEVSFVGTLADPAVTVTEAYGVDDSGTIFGAIGSPGTGTNTEGFAYANGSFTAVAAPGATTTVLYGTDNIGDVVGYVVDAEGDLTGYATGPTANGPISVPGNGTTSFTFAYGINDAGTVVGAYDDSTGLHGFIEAGGQFTTVDEPDAVGSTRLYDINNAGQISGSAFVGGHYVPFIYQDGNFTLYTGVNVVDGRRIGINDLGQITGENSQDGDGFVITPNVACYARGTLIETCHGPKPVEALAVGEVLVTAAGQHRPITWIGRRSYAGRFLAANPKAQPIRFSAGSLGYGLPRRDLLVSPDHAMFLNGVLVAARHLVNGTTVVQACGLERVDYFHVELDSHDVILAEGAPSESFVDDGSRCMFHNAAEWMRRHPGHRRVPAVFCARRVDSGPELNAVRRQLDAAAGQGVRAA